MRYLLKVTGHSEKRDVQICQMENDRDEIKKDTLNIAHAANRKALVVTTQPQEE